MMDAIRVSDIVKFLLPVEWARRVKVARRRWEHLTFRRRVVTHVYGQCKLAVSIEDRTAERWYDHDWPSLPEITILTTHRLRRGATVFNIGAHQAVVAMMLGAEVGERGLVVAVEPDWHNAKVAQLNVHRNSYSQIKVLRGAAASYSGWIRFDDSDSNGRVGGSSAAVSLVPCYSIDDLAKEFGGPDVLFIDAEGSECEVLRGAARTLEATRPDCFVEVHVGVGLEALGGSVSRLTTYFPPDRYQLLLGSPGFSAGDAFKPFKPDLPEVQQRFLLLAIAK